MSTVWGSTQDKFDSIACAIADARSDSTDIEIAKAIDSPIRTSVMERGTSRTRGTLLKAADAKVVVPDATSLIQYISLNHDLARKYIEALGEWAGEDFVRVLDAVLGSEARRCTACVKSIIFAMKQIGGSFAVRQLCSAVINGDCAASEAALEGLHDLVSIGFPESVEGGAVRGSKLSEKILLLSEQNDEFHKQLVNVPEFVMLNTLKRAVVAVNDTKIGYLAREVLAGALSIAEKVMLEELSKWSMHHYEKLIAHECESEK